MILGALGAVAGQFLGQGLSAFAKKKTAVFARKRGRRRGITPSQLMKMGMIQSVLGKDKEVTRIMLYKMLSGGRL